MRRLALTLALAGGLAAGVAHGQEAGPPADLEKQAYAKIVEARGSARAERYADALSQLDDAVALAERLEGKLALALALHNKGEVELLRGRPLDALKAYHRVLRVYTQLGHQAGAAMVQKRIGTLTRFVRKPDKPAGAPARGAPAAKKPEALSRIDQAVERIRSRMKPADPPPPAEPAQASAPASPAEPLPPAPVEAGAAREQPPPPAQAGGPSPPPPAQERQTAPDAAYAAKSPPPPAPAPADRPEDRPRPAPVSRTEEPPPASVEVARTEPRAAADNPRQWAYVESLKRKISGKSRYPAYAEQKGQQGAVELVFAVQDNGEVDRVELSRSSGFIVLDVEALRNVRESAPFGPVPSTGASGPLTVRLTFSYRLPAPPDEAPGAAAASGSEG